MTTHHTRTSSTKSGKTKARWSTSRKLAARKAPATDAERRTERRSPERRGADRLSDRTDTRSEYGRRPGRPTREERSGQRGSGQNRSGQGRSGQGRSGQATWNRRDDRPYRGRSFSEDERRDNGGDRSPRGREDRWADDRRGGGRAPSRPIRDAKDRDRSRGESRSPQRHSAERPFHKERFWNDREDRAPRSNRYSSRQDRSQQDRPQQYGSQQDRPQRGRSNLDRTEQGRSRREWEVDAQETRPAVATVNVADDNGFAALGLPPELVERLARDGITSPFPIQQATIPDALSGRDVLGRGQTGSGKTLAFALPTLTRLAGGRSQRNRPRALVLVPTRELAMQVADAVQPLAHVLGLRHKLIAGGMPYQPQLDALDRGVDILIATPGRMNDLVERGAARLDAVEVAVLDEADHMAEMGFLPEITTLLDLIPVGGQRLLFSATLDRGIDGVVERYLTDPVTHEADPGTASVSTMEHHVLLVEPQHKQPLTAELASRPGRTVVFVRTKLGADRVAAQLRQRGVVAAALHGGLGQGQRNRVLAAFKTGRVPVLVATDVAARGIHVDDVSAVIQVDPPADHKDYLHRSGRTARAGDRGTVVTLALPHQRATMRRLAREAGLEVAPRRTAPGDEALRDATGATEPTGEPLSEQDFQKLIEGEPKRRRFQGGPRRGGRPPYGKPRRRD